MNQAKTCLNCGQKAVIDLPYGPHRYCRQHFQRFFEKRVRKNSRLREKILKTDSALIALDGSAASQALLHLIPEIVSPKNKLQAFFLGKARGIKAVRELAKKRGIEILPGRFKEAELKKLAGKNRKLVWPFALEDEAVEKLSALMKKGKAKAFLVKPLNSSPEKEIEFYCNLKKIPFTPGAQKNRWRQWLDDFEQTFPGTGFSLMKSLKQLENLK